MIDEAVLRTALRELADHDEAVTPPVAGLLRRGRQARVGRVVRTAGVVGLAGVLAAAVAVGSTRPARPGTNQPGVAVAQSPSMQLAAAVVASQNTSYRMKITAAVEGDSPWTPDRGDTGPLIVEGAFDPATATGELRSVGAPSGGFELRLINGVLYSRVGGYPFHQSGVKWDKLPYPLYIHGPLMPSADLNKVFETLKRLNGTVRQTSANSYHIEVDRTIDTIFIDKLVGDVTVDAHKRVAKITTVQTGQAEIGGRTHTRRSLVTIVLSDYGTPITVERPRDVKVDL
jgi:hypothetical protein